MQRTSACMGRKKARRRSRSRRNWQAQREVSLLSEMSWSLRQEEGAARGGKGEGAEGDQRHLTQLITNTEACKEQHWRWRHL